MTILENLAFGIDLGIGSCGWAVIESAQQSENTGTIKDLGSWIFDVPETDKERTPTNQIRRGNRLLRRVIRRRRNRMSDLRRLFNKQGLIAEKHGDALKHKGLDPWELRARGLDRLLSNTELAVALGHIAKRRGFKSAAKNKAANTTSDDKKMLMALQVTQEKLARCRTVGEMFARDPDFALRRRNRDGVYDRTGSRDDLAREVSTLFQSQRRLGNAAATTELEDSYIAIAFRQNPMQDSERLVGQCVFEKAEKRAAKYAPSFEIFRLLQRLINLRVTTSEGGERALTPLELSAATVNLGKTKTLTVKRIRDMIGLASEFQFTAIKSDDEKNDIAARTGEAMYGKGTLRTALGEDLWAKALTTPEKLDQIAHVLSFFETLSTIEAELRKLSLDGDMLTALLQALEADSFAKFKGAAHISAKAVRALLPHMARGERYDRACDLAGYNHAASEISRVEQVTNKASFNALVAEVGETIANPIARKALTEGLKQLWAMRNAFGLPGAIHIELARDVGNSLEKRKEIESGLEKATKAREDERKKAAEQLGIPLENVNGEALLRYRLWFEQNGKCLYTGAHIDPGQYMSNDYQVDHILPWSRFGDDSFNNKTLCAASANQRKKGATPFEWFAREKSPDEWDTFVARVESCKAVRGFKKRNYTLKNAADAEERFRSRNLNDTRYACRILAEAVKLFYPKGDRQEKGGNRRVFTRPGALTAALRQAWGLESLKKINGERIADDRHHALDALVVAAVSEGEVLKLTKSFQAWEQQGLGRRLRSVAEPWEGFRAQAKEAYAEVFVARPERRRARGEGHAATVRQIVEVDGEQKTTERVAVLSLGMDKNKFSETKALDQLQHIRDPARNKQIVDSITGWIAAGRPTAAESLPRSPRGHVITKIKLMSRTKPAVLVRHGTADRGEMVRVDVFSKAKAKGKGAGKDEWYLVPVYPHQVMNKKDWPQPPMRAVAAHKDESEWFQLDESYRFRFSLYPRSCVEVIKSDGEVFGGYFTGLHRGTGNISIFDHNNTKSGQDGIGPRKLLTINKYAVDRFGRKSLVRNEVRTWHGEVCTSLSPPG